MPRAKERGSTELSETGQAIQALRQARDAGIARVAELTEKLRVASDTIEDLRDAKELAEFERDASIERLMAAQADSRKMRTQLDKFSDGGDNKRAELQTRERDQAAGDGRNGEGKDRQQETVANLIDQFGEERRRLLGQLEDLKTTSSVQIAALHAQLAAHAKDSIAATEAARQRLDIANLRVELDELREELKLARRSEPEPTPDAEPDVIMDSVATIEDMPAPAIGPDNVKSELAAIDWYLAEVERDLTHPESLDVLASLFRDFAERGVLIGCMAANRVALACADVCVWLRKTPRKIPDTIALLKEGRTVIGRLFENGVAAAIADPAGSQVYAVDNDVDNCECIVMALEKAAFQTRYATKAEVAFRDIANGPVDLIILDVDLGETDGFLLHQLIREVDFHAETPVIFVSGLYSTQERLAELPGPRAAFVAKPYNLNELVLKALCTILTPRLDRLQAAQAESHP